jgi:hypothetical protein
MGADKNLDNGSYSKSHEMNKLPEDDACMNCHDRSGRISLSYAGLYESNNSLVPTVNGEPGPVIYSGVRSIRHIEPDIHSKGGLECIDCHTQAEIMGDGYSYENMYTQQEIKCENCHGTADKLPETEKAVRELNRAFASSKSYFVPLESGAVLALTDKGRPFTNVFHKESRFWLAKKRTGEIKEIKTILNSAEHEVKGHERMDCSACHSKVVTQCYGCHTKYDKRSSQYDYTTGEATAGAFSETEDIRTFYPFPLAFNQLGKIVPVVPGSQTFFTYIDDNGTVLKDEHVFNFRGKKRLKFAPFYSHNMGKKAVGCSECHANPYFYGGGDGLFSYSDKTLTSPIINDVQKVPLTSIFSIKKGKLTVNGDIVREGSRIISAEEIVKIINANRCIICHNKAAENGRRYYGEIIDYEKTLSDNIHAPLFR